MIWGRVGKRSAREKVVELVLPDSIPDQTAEGKEEDFFGTKSDFDNYDYDYKIDTPDLEGLNFPEEVKYSEVDSA